MHIFVTGEIQIGKSTVLRKTMEGLGVPVGGFRTFFAQERTLPDKSLYIAGISPGDASVTQVVQFIEGSPHVLTERFDSVGGMLLRKARESAMLIIMDECGRLERDALQFQKEVFRTLDGDIPVLGVVRHGAGGWTEGIYRHPGVEVITVDKDNRDRLPAEFITKMMRVIQWKK